MSYEVYPIVLEFEIIKPTDELEKTGEKLYLSYHGGYSPPRSLRGYKFEELISKPKNYRATRLSEIKIEHP
jgi:hypothetical protein